MIVDDVHGKRSSADDLLFIKSVLTARTCYIYSNMEIAEGAYQSRTLLREQLFDFTQKVKHFSP